MTGTGGCGPEREARSSIGWRLFKLMGLGMTVAGLTFFLAGVVNGDTAMWVWGLAFSLMGLGVQSPVMKH